MSERSFPERALLVRRALLQRFATLAADRLAWLEDPVGMAALRSARRVE